MSYNAVNEERHLPVCDRTLKNDDFPTLGSPIGCQRGEWRVKSDKKERTDDANLEVIARATKKGFLLLRRWLFGRHPLFDGGKRSKREGKATSEQRRSIAA